MGENKNIVQQGRPQLTTWRIACWTPKATNTHPEYVILIASSTARAVGRTQLDVTSYVHCVVNIAVANRPGTVKRLVERLHTTLCRISLICWHTQDNEKSHRYREISGKIALVKSKSPDRSSSLKREKKFSESALMTVLYAYNNNTNSYWKVNGWGAVHCAHINWQWCQCSCNHHQQ